MLESTLMWKFLSLLYTTLPLIGGTLQVSIAPEFGSKALTLDSIKYQQSETFSVSRLSYLLSDFALLDSEGKWLPLENQYAYLDEAKRRRTFELSKVPEGSYQGFRFSVGIPKKTNHSDPAKHPADHPLNPNFNQLHWDWKTGYIFMALEGRYRPKSQPSEKELKGYVYHLANDENLSRIQLATRFQIKNSTRLRLSLDLKKLLGHPREISFEKDGASTHSHPGDSIASSLVANLQSSFSVKGIDYAAGDAPQKQITPIDLPKAFTPFPFKMSGRFPIPPLPRDNPLIQERAELGAKLFSDPILSADQSISCATCHEQSAAFSDQRKFSLGVEKRIGTRNSMPLFNLAWKSSFFWDGRARSLREQVLSPIQDHNEMASSLKEVSKRLNAALTYRDAFLRAFSSGKITPENIALALENHILTLTSYDSKFDRAMSGKATLSATEKRGMELFFTEYEPRSQQFGADCFHCHGGANFSDHQFHNNGLKPTSDSGRFQFTKNKRDQNLFSTPSLRNIALTAPYMHDGRFKTLEEAVVHYSGPMHRSETLDPNLAKHPKGGLQLKKEDQAALVDFLKTLSDPKYLRGAKKN